MQSRCGYPRCLPQARVPGPIAPHLTAGGRNAHDPRLRSRRAFADKQKLAADLAGTLMRIEQVPDIPMFRREHGRVIHELPADCLSNVDGDSTYVRVRS